MWKMCETLSFPMVLVYLQSAKFMWYMYEVYILNSTYEKGVNKVLQIHPNPCYDWVRLTRQDSCVVILSS